jgi:Carboxypeptidase regulatory-like domain
MRGTLLMAVGALTLLSTSPSAQTPATATVTKLLPGTRVGVLSSIQGNAVTSTNGALADTVVRLRDARYGRIVSTVMSDKQGAFAFRGLDPGNYVVEVMSPANNAVLASSPVLNVSTGEAISALVKLPFRIPPFAGLIGNASQTTASAVSTAAQAVTAAATSSNTVAETLVGVAATSNTTGNGR